MAFFDCIRKLFWGEKDDVASPEDLAREEELRERVRERCALFRRLLTANKTALEIMSDIEAHLAGERPFGMDYVDAAATRIAASVLQMVRSLNALSRDRYASLRDAFDRILMHMDALRGAVPSAEDGAPRILPLPEIRLSDMPEVGGKMANLGEIRANVGLPVPDGFAVTVNAYRHFMEFGGLTEEIARMIQATDLGSIEDVLILSQSLQRLVIRAPLPPDLEEAITGAVDDLKVRCGEDVRLALRSSAVGEDALDASFAGQYRSELNVCPDEACEVWKEIVASKYSVSAMTYRYQRGIPDDAAPMSVGVLAMVKARAGGVAYSRNPVQMEGREDCVVINAVPGLPQGVVDGGIMPDVYTCSRVNPPAMLEKVVASDNPSLSEEEALRLARIAVALEEYYAEPQDVEWAVDKAGHVTILQSRPLRQTYNSQTDAPETPSLPSLDEASVLARGGISVSPGVGIGRVYILNKEADMLSFPEGGVMVIKHANPRWAALLPHAAGLISETGGTAGHLASVAREYRVPALFGIASACSLLEGCGDVTVDVGRRLVLAGRQENLLPKGPEKPVSLMLESPVHRRLKALAELITPLHLLDPESSDFAPEQCTTLHDITRFCHEKAVGLMFFDGGVGGERFGKQLKAGAKMQYWIVNMGGGFQHPVSGSVVDISNIASLPMLALWDGMTAVPWMGPPACGTAGFMSVVMESAMNPELESTAPSSMAERNFFIIDARYMILQARYGYHFCTVECQAGEDSGANLVSFQFKGGAADRERRVLRARMLADLLEGHGFRVDVREDALFAVADGLSAREILQKTALIGYLLIHSRQSDMIMKERASAAAFRQKLADDMATIANRTLSFMKKL